MVCDPDEGMPTSRGYQTGKHLEAFILVIIARQPMHWGGGRAPRPEEPFAAALDD